MDITNREIYGMVFNISGAYRNCGLVAASYYSDKKRAVCERILSNDILNTPLACRLAIR